MGFAAAVATFDVAVIFLAFSQFGNVIIRKKHVYATVLVTELRIVTFISYFVLAVVL